MRAFARDLGISPGRLSEILGGGNIPGKRLTRRIITSLKLDADDTSHIMRVVDRQKKIQTELKGAHQLDMDQFSLIADRENFSLLCLLETENFVSDISWMAERLNVSEATVRDVLERLSRLGLIKQGPHGYQSTHKDITTSHNIPSAAIREYHTQGLKHATESLLNVDPDLRDITSIEMPTDLNKLKIAKEHIRDFRRKIAKLLEEGETTEVYRLNIQLVPVTNVAGSRKGAHT
ncbi:DUF4423 domain-containing protein [Bdellovibrio bacteriovorus]|uniref:DUF4423 domain-containing protein n=2 Tax=Bdellovibrio TaxID=958 RepID=UPI0035A64A30